jgi:UrcA family protein
MRKTILCAAAALSFTALPALAGSTTVEFVAADGTTSVVVFNTDGTASMDGGDAIKYKMDEATKTVCGETPDGELCATFEEVGSEVGFSTGYTNTAGVTGTATITAVSE